MEAIYYLGNYSRKQIPLKIALKQEGKKLGAQAAGKNAFPLEYGGDQKFTFTKDKGTGLF